MYDTPDASAGMGTAVATMPTTAEEVSNDLLDQVRSDPELFARLMETVIGSSATWACPTEELLIHDETRAVEYQQTARWNVREQWRDKTMEQVIIKTVAGMLNDRGGTLLIGITDGGEPVGLDHDYNQVKPPNADGYINWLDTLFRETTSATQAPTASPSASTRSMAKTSAASTCPPAPAPSGSRTRTDPTPSTNAATTQRDPSRHLR